MVGHIFTTSMTIQRDISTNPKIYPRYDIWVSKYFLTFNFSNFFHPIIISPKFFPLSINILLPTKAIQIIKLNLYKIILHFWYHIYCFFSFINSSISLFFILIFEMLSANTIWCWSNLIIGHQQQLSKVYSSLATTSWIERSVLEPILDLRLSNDQLVGLPQTTIDLSPGQPSWTSQPRDTSLPLIGFHKEVYQLFWFYLHLYSCKGSCKRKLRWEHSCLRLATILDIDMNKIMKKYKKLLHPHASQWEVTWFI